MHAMHTILTVVSGVLFYGFFAVVIGAGIINIINERKSRGHERNK